jgi:hypothetical protein
VKRFVIALLDAYRRTRLAWWRLRGRTPEDHHADRVVSGRAWAEYCDTLKAAGAALAYGDAPRDAFTQAEGYRYLSRLTRAGLEAFVEYADPAFPVLRRMVHETVKLGADNPDNWYENAQISGAYRYRIHGHRGTVHYLGFFTQDGSYGSTGGLAPRGALEARDMVFDADGRFEILLCPPEERPASGNWLEIGPETTLLMVRQTFLDRAGERIATLRVEAVDGPPVPPPLTAARVDEGLNTAGTFVAGASMLFARWTQGFRGHVNRLPLFDPAVSNAAGGAANFHYYHSYWRLGPDECLVIEAVPPPCTHWNFQLNNVWMESLDYRYHTIHVNQHTAVYADDGSVRIVVAHGDPGLPNWITTCGHAEGTMCFRWVDAPHSVEPACRVVALSRLRAEGAAALSHGPG